MNIEGFSFQGRMSPPIHKIHGECLISVVWCTENRNLVGANATGSPC